MSLYNLIQLLQGLLLPIIVVDIVKRKKVKKEEKPKTLVNQILGLLSKVCTILRGMLILMLLLSIIILPVLKSNDSYGILDIEIYSKDG